MKTLRPYQEQAIAECWAALKRDNNPVLLMASVGAGKSLMLANVLLKIQAAGKNALCIVNNAELVRGNCEAFRGEGGGASIYCAALNEKDITESVIFGTPQSILNGINKNEPIGKIRFNIIIVDEAHNINYLNHSSCFMRILRHYRQEYPKLRVLGATGTNFRFKGNGIVGDGCLFRSQVGNITTEDLIVDGYLVKPKFEVDENLILDFSRVKLKQNGQFDQKQLAEVVDGSTRLTALICTQIIHIMESQCRFGCFIFATTKKHAYEILGHLPANKSAIILGDTPQNERTQILEAARLGNIKYLVNIAIISVGVDVPAFDTIAYLRPTDSLVLLVQTMGRALRLSNATGKKDALILDFAGNIERHRDWDNPILLEALKETVDKDKPLVILCPECNEMNTEHARRCVGVGEDARCNYYFEFKACDNCEAKNDIAARICRLCQAELIDPNAKLSLDRLTNMAEVDVIEARFGISGTAHGFRISCAYKCRDKQGREGSIFETFTPSSTKAQHVFYGQFIRKHCIRASFWYPHITDRNKMIEMLKEARIPVRLGIEYKDNNYKIRKKIFEVKDDD